jgi:uncharacterized membrane protein
MSDLIALAYPAEDQAAQVMTTLRHLNTEHLLELEDACYVTRDSAGNVELHQAIDLAGAGAATGALGGALWGGLIGLLFLAPLAGMIIGAAAGAAGGAVSGTMTDYGISDDFMRKLGSELQPGTSAIFLLVRKLTLDKVLPEVSKYGGKVLQTSLSAEADQRLEAALQRGSAVVA